MPSTLCIAPNCNQFAGANNYCDRHLKEFQPVIQACRECGKPTKDKYGICPECENAYWDDYSDY